MRIETSKSEGRSILGGIVSAVPWAGMIALLFVLGWSRSQVRQVEARTKAFADGMAERLRSESMQQDSAAQVGDLLELSLASEGATDTVEVARLAASGVRFLYFHRHDCPLCAELTPRLLANTSSSDRKRLAFLAYRPRTSEPASEGWPTTFGVLADERRYAVTRFTPAIVEVDSRGIVLAVADGFEPTVRFLRSRSLLHDTTFQDRVRNATNAK